MNSSKIIRPKITERLIADKTLPNRRQSEMIGSHWNDNEAECWNVWCCNLPSRWLSTL